MTTPTSTAVPSQAPQDLLYNAERFDEVLNSGATAYTDRLGVNRLTLAGAMQRIAGTNVRGAWASGTAYALRDVVTYSGFAYICVTAHTSTSTFDAAKWRIDQGDAARLESDLATMTPTSGAAMIAFDDGLYGGTARNIQRLGTRLREYWDERAKPSRMELIAHRGFSGFSAQNTSLAFTMALRRGADSLECDVQVSSDGLLFCFHDTTVDALTNGTGTFTSLASSYIYGLTFDSLSSTVVADTGIPLFALMLRIAREAGVRIYPEIKGYRTQSDISLMVSAVTSAKMEHLTTFQSFNMSDLTYVRGINNNVGVGFLGSGSTYTSYVDTLAALGNGHLLWDYSSLLATPAIVEYCYARGVGIAAWTVNSTYYARQLANIGVYRVMSDNCLSKMDGR